MSNRPRISSKGLMFYAPLTDEYLQTSTLASDLSAYHKHATVTNGSPTFSAAGMTGGGVGDGLFFPQGDMFTFPQITIAMRFTPNTSADTNDIYLLFDSPANTSFPSTPNVRIIHQWDAGSNELQIKFGGVNVVLIPLATYDPYWVVGQENTIIITSDADADLTNVWMNGTQIVTDDTTAWAPEASTTDLISIGTDNNGDWGMSGEIRDVMVFNRLWTASEREAFNTSSRGLYAPAKTSTLQKGLIFHAPLTDDYLQTSVLPSDISANHNHATSVNNTPTYSSVGVNLTSQKRVDFLVDNIMNTDLRTIAIRFTPNFASSDDIWSRMISTPAAKTYIDKTDSTILAWANKAMLIVSGDNTNLGIIPEATYGQYWNVGVENTLIVTYDSVTPNTKTWLNGNLILNSSTAFTPLNDQSIFIGSGNASADFDGEMRDFRIWNRLLTDAERAEYDSLVGPAKNKTTNLEKGLILDMPLTSEWIQSSTLASDRSTSRNHGTATGTPPTFGSDGVTLNGTSDFIDLGDNYEFDVASDAFSMGTWFNGQGDGGTTELMTRRHASNNEQYSIFLTADNYIRSQMYDGTTTLNYADTVDLNDGQWHLVVMTYNGSNTMHLYLDGEDVSGAVVGSLSGLDTSGASFFVGKGSNGFFNGKMQKAKIWNRELSASEVLNLYRQDR